VKGDTPAHCAIGAYMYEIYQKFIEKGTNKTLRHSSGISVGESLLEHQQKFKMVRRDTLREENQEVSCMYGNLLLSGSLQSL